MVFHGIRTGAEVQNKSIKQITPFFNSIELIFCQWAIHLNPFCVWTGHFDKKILFYPKYDKISKNGLEPVLIFWFVLFIF